MTPEQLAELFHTTYERLAPSYGYETRPETAIQWKDISEDSPNKQLMIAVAGEILKCLNSPKCNHCERQDGTVRMYVEVDKPIEMTHTNTPDYMCDTCYFGGAAFLSEYYRLEVV